MLSIYIHITTFLGHACFKKNILKCAHNFSFIFQLTVALVIGQIGRSVLDLVVKEVYRSVFANVPTLLRYLVEDLVKKT